MANKKSLFDFFKSTGRNAAPREPDCQTRQKELILRLQSIDLADPQNRLSQEKIRELNLSGVIQYVSRELNTAAPAAQDIPALDKNIDYIILALQDAILQGHEMTAQWACTALVSSVKNLRADIPGIDRDQAKALMDSRLEYSENLKLLVQLCREHDILSQNLDSHRRRLESKAAERIRLKEDLLARRKSGALDLPLAELEMKAHAPATMSDEALTLRDELIHLHLLSESIEELETTIDADRKRLKQLDAQIDILRNALSTPPRAQDPSLQSRIAESYHRYLASLEASAMSDDWDALPSENLRLQKQVELLQEQLRAAEQETSRESCDFHSYLEEMTFEELIDLDFQ